MRKVFEAIWEKGNIIPTETIQINEHTRLLVVVIDEPTVSDKTFLIQEARRQSLLVSQQEPPDEIWEANIDASEWRV